MRYSIIYILIFSVTFLSSCRWWDGEEQIEAEKQFFNIETRLWSELQNETLIEKVWQVRSTQDIQVSSQVSWRVVNLSINKWQRVREWQVIAELQDTSWNLIFSSERAWITLERAVIQKESTLLSQEKQLFDLDIQITDIERSLRTLRSDREQNIRLLEDNLQSTDLTWENSSSRLQLDQFDANLEKLRLDFETSLVADWETRQSFIDFFVSNENTLRVLLDDVIDFADPIFSITEKNRFSNSRFNSLIWARNSSQRAETEKLLRELIEFRNSWFFSSFRANFTWSELTDEEILTWFKTLSETYDILRVFLPELNQTFINTVESAWQLSSSELERWRSTTQGFQSSFSSNFNNFISTQNQAKSFLRTYLSNQESQRRAISLQERERDLLQRSLESWSLSAEVSNERAILEINDRIEWLESQLEQIKNTRDTTQRDIEITRRNLDNSISEASLWQRQSDFELSKLVVRSPIDWVVEDILIDEGQEIQAWTPVVSLLAESTPEIQVSVSDYERNLIRAWQSVYIDIGRERFEWTISSVWEVADTRFNFPVSVGFRAAWSVLWSIARISIPVENDDFLLPIRIIDPIWDWQGRVPVLENGNIELVRLRLWRVFWDNIEVLSCARDCDLLEIIWSDISNFNPDDFTLRKK